MNTLPTETDLQVEAAPVVASKKLFPSRFVIESGYQTAVNIRVQNKAACLDADGALIGVEEAPAHLKAATITIEPQDLAEQITVIDPVTLEEVTVSIGVVYRALTGKAHEAAEAAEAAQAVVIVPEEVEPVE